MLGVIYSLLTVLGFALTYFVVRLATQHIRPSSVTFISATMAGIVGFALASIFLRDQLLSVSLVAFGWFCVVAFVQVLLARYLSYTSIHMAGITRATPVLSTTPLFATLFGVVFLDERVTPLLLIGTLAITAGIILIVRQQSRA